MKPLLVLAAVLALATPAAAQGARPFQAYFGNTLISRHADGVEHHVWLNADDTYVIRQDGKVIASGTYTYADGKICLKAGATAAPACLAAYPDKKVGDTWPTQGPGGAPETHILIAGRK